MEFVGRLTSLNFDRINSWTNDDLMAVATKATRLELLYCVGDSLDDGLAARIVEALPRLTTLRLDSPALSDASCVPLKGLRKLEYLNLGCPSLTPAGLVELGKIRSLKKLEFRKGKLTHLDIATFKTENPGLQVLVR
jgi:hypothetical protein